jgi:hypothetical protein
MTQGMTTDRLSLDFSVLNATTQTMSSSVGVSSDARGDVALDPRSHLLNIGKQSDSCMHTEAHPEKPLRTRPYPDLRDRH